MDAAVLAVAAVDCLRVRRMELARHAFLIVALECKVDDVAIDDTDRRAARLPCKGVTRGTLLVDVRRPIMTETRRIF